MQHELERAHIQVLVNEALRIGPFVLVGLDERTLWRPNMDKFFADAARKGGVPITAVHSPRIMPIMPDNTPLVMIGHTHCGQIVLSGWDNSFDLLNWKPRFNTRYRCGLVHDWHHTAITTAGVGGATFPPLRINAPPDFWIITLIPRD